MMSDRTSPRVVLAAAVGVSAVLCGTAAIAQDSPRLPSVVELVRTYEIKEATAFTVPPGGVAEWRPADAPASRGLVVSIRATFSGEITAELDPPDVTLNYSVNGTWHKASCIGVSFPDDLVKGRNWSLRDHTGKVVRHVSSAGRTIKASFLFEVPPNISDVSLVYKGSAVLKELPLPWK